MHSALSPGPLLWEHAMLTTTPYTFAVPSIAGLAQTCAQCHTGADRRAGVLMRRHELLQARMRSLFPLIPTFHNTLICRAASAPARYMAWQ